MDQHAISQELIKFITGPVFMGFVATIFKAIYDRIRVPDNPDYDSSRDAILTKAQEVYADSNAPLLKELAADVQLVRISETLLKNELGDLANQLDREFKQAMWGTFPGLAVAVSAFILSWPSKYWLGLFLGALGLLLSFFGIYDLFRVFKGTFDLRNNYQVQEIKALKEKASSLRKCDPSRDDIGQILATGKSDATTESPAPLDGDKYKSP